VDSVVTRAAAGQADGNIPTQGVAPTPERLPDPPSPVADRPAAESLRELRASARPRLYRTVLRYGVTPFLLLADASAWFAASLFVGWRSLDPALLVATVVLYALHGLYRSRLSLSVVDDTSHLVGRALVGLALVVTADSFLARTGQQGPLLATALVCVAATFVLRSVAYAVVRGFRARGLIAHQTLILGAGRVGAQITSLLIEHPEYGLRPVGMLDQHPLLSESERPVPLLGGHEALAQTIVEFGVRDVIVAFSSMPESGLVEVIRTCDRLDCEIFFVPRLFELHTVSRDMDHVWGLPLVRLRRPVFRSPWWKAKRMFDFAVSLLALVLLAPLLAVLAAAVRLEGGPGVIFRQTRVGLDNRPFQLLKFRSLRPVDETESQTQWNVQHDSRLGRVGRFLRQTSLDELPQLWNILRGDMSLVGPRPERPHFVDSFAGTFPRYIARHRVPAGLTGWAQVHGLRGDTSIEERARFDNYYIENWSLWLDLRIIVMTTLSVLRRAGG